MDIPNASTSSQAVAHYAAQSQAAQTKSRSQENEAQVRGQGVKAQGGDRVTLSAQSLQGAGRTNESQTNHNNVVQGAASTQATEHKRASNPAATRAAESKSVTQALEAYVQTSLA